MMHQYQLQKYSGIQSRYRCPACQNRRKTLSLYVDIQTNQPLSANVGRCSREVKCGYHYTPKQWFADSGEGNKVQRTRIKDSCKPKSLLFTPCSFISAQLFKQTLKAYHKNHLTAFLKHIFGIETAQMLIQKYRIGTAKHWPGATVFWQIDVDGKVRAGKVMLYNGTTGKRVKQPFNHVTWVHTILKLQKYELQQCFFGEHLLAGNSLPVAIVESEKTAVIASAFLPGWIWLASGSVANLSVQKCNVLIGRKVYLFPDVDVYTTWQQKATELSHITGFKVSNLLEITAKEQCAGFDLADHLISWYEYQKCAK